MSQTNNIYLDFGQSWTAGISNTIPELQPAYAGRSINLRVMTDTGFQCIDSALNNNQYPTVYRQNGCAIEFYFRDIAEHLGSDVYLCKVAKGGTSLGLNAGGLDWNVASTNELYDHAMSAIADCITWMNDRGKDYVFKGCIWWQGEEDAVSATYSAAYETNLINLFDDIKTATSTPDLKFYQYYMTLPRDYTAVVNTAKTNFTNLDTANRRIFTPIVSGFQPDGVHPTMAANLTMWTNQQLPLIIADL